MDTRAIRRRLSMTSMSVKRCAPLALSAVLAAAGIASAMEVETRHDPDADFTAYRTFDHLPRQPAPERGPFAPGTDYDRRLRDIIERRLEGRGFQAVDADPDFLVAYSLGREERLDTSGGRREITRGVSIAWEEGELVRASTEGTLVIEILDAESREPVWIGWATEVIDDPDRLLQEPERLMRKIDKAVRRVVRRFPPRDR
jgi:hypothetical protein